MSTTDTDLSMLSINTALAPAPSFDRESRGPRDGFARNDRNDRSRVLDVNNFDAIRISLASAVLGCIVGFLGLFVWVAIVILHILAMVKGVNGGRLIIPGVSQYADRL